MWDKIYNEWTGYNTNKTERSLKRFERALGFKFDLFQGHNWNTNTKIARHKSYAILRKFILITLQKKRHGKNNQKNNHT